MDCSAYWKVTLRWTNVLLCEDPVGRPVEVLQNFSVWEQQQQKRHANSLPVDVGGGEFP